MHRSKQLFDHLVDDSPDGRVSPSALAVLSEEPDRRHRRLLRPWNGSFEIERLCRNQKLQDFIQSRPLRPPARNWGT
jgi:hypothetical protein